MNILLPGCAGFIGTNFTKSTNHNIIGIDDFSSGIGNATIKQSITEPLNIIQDIDIVINMACVASPKKYLEQPIHVMDTNYNGTKNLLEYCLKKNIPLVHLSTSEIYGDPLQHPQTETYNGNVNPIGPRSCYDEGKRISETLCYEYSKLGVNVIILRLFNTYGPNMLVNDGRIISNFINQALSNQPITVYGNGLQTRSFCYIDDMVQAINIVSQSHITGFDVFNVGNPYEYSVLSVAQLISEQFDVPIEYQSLPEDDPVVRRPDISKFTKKYKWNPTTPLESGLQKTIKYFSCLS